MPPGIGTRETNSSIGTAPLPRSPEVVKATEAYDRRMAGIGRRQFTFLAVGGAGAMFLPAPGAAAGLAGSFALVIASGGVCSFCGRTAAARLIQAGPVLLCAEC